MAGVCSRSCVMTPPGAYLGESAGQERDRANISLTNATFLGQDDSRFVSSADGVVIVYGPDGRFARTWRIQPIRPFAVNPEASPNSEAPGENTIPRDVEDRWYRTTVDVFDPVRRQLVARAELPFLGILA